MPSSISRYIGADFLSSLKPNCEPRISKPVSETVSLKKKEYAWNLHDRRSCKNYLSMSRNLQTTTFVRHSNVNPPPPEAPLPSGSPSGSLRNWIVGIVVTFILPLITHKWGSLLLLKNKVDQKIEVTEHVVKSIENVAERVDKVIDSITDDLPKDSRLKKALESVDELAEGVAKSAHVVDDLIIRVEEAEDKLESLISHENLKGDKLSHKDEYKRNEDKDR